MVNQSVRQVSEASFNKSKLKSTAAISRFLFKSNRVFPFLFNILTQYCMTWMVVY